MTTTVTFNHAHRISLASDFFMARRPVLDREQELAAHELLFCGTANGTQAPQQGDACVIEDVARHGLARVIGDVPALLHVDADALLGDTMRLLPPRLVIPVIDRMSAPAAALVERLAALVQAGFRFALDAGGEMPPPQLLPLAEIIRIDVGGYAPQALRAACERFKADRKTLLAENVDSPERCRIAQDAGFDYFQGYHFTRPQIHAGQRLSVSQAAVIELMSLIASDADSADIEHSIKGDVALGLNLLRLVNTPAISAHRIESLRQALMVLGRDQLQRWLQIMLYAQADQGRPGMRALMLVATARGRLLELIAQKTRPGNRGIADTAFTVGIMSLMDTLFGMAMADLLRQIQVVDEVADALLRRKGYFGELLDLAEYTEWAEKTDTPLLHAIGRQRLSCSDLYMLQLAAFEWSDHVARSVR